MTDCERLRADAAGLAALPEGDPERRAARAHAAGCEGCARALREAERLQALLAGWRPDPLSGGALARASAAIEQELRREGRRRSAWAAGAAAFLMALLLGLARHRTGTALDWVLLGGLAAAALALSALAARRPLPVVAAAAAAAVAAALAGGGPGPLEPGVGLHCLLSELVTGALVVTAGWVALRGGTTTLSRRAAAATAAAGALAAEAVLQVTCGSHGFGAHLIVFHAGGVLLAAAGAALLWTVRARPVA
jgi:hypothetical protein